jgi:uncharacterized membrane protein YdfJ with MMPL/SSD domain
VLTRLAALAASHPRRLALAALAAFLVAAVLGAPAPGRLDAQRGFDDPGSQSALAREQIEAATGRDADAEVVALVRAAPGSAESGHVARVLRSEAAVAHVDRIASRDGRATLLPATLRAGARATDVVDRLTATLRDDRAVVLGGNAVAGTQVREQATSDLAVAELIAFPLLALLSLLIFRGVAALLPIAVGGLGVLGAFALLRAVNTVLPLSPFALNLVIGLGLGLAIDYSLLCVSRFREELGAGAEVPAALRATLLASGRTIVFSAVTVAAAMACLTVFPQRFLVSMGIGGVLVALVAVMASLLVLPPLFVLLGPRLGKVRPGSERSGGWYRLARAVMRRPGLTAAATAAGLLLVAAPALGIKWTGVDAGVLPSGKSARIVSDTIAHDFPGADASPLTLAISAPPDAGPALRRYADRLRAVSGVRRVSAPRDLGRGTWQLDVATGGLPSSSAAQRAVERVRSAPAPYRVAVGGAAAGLRDQRAAVAHTAPLALGLLAVLTLAILWLMTGSVVLPLKTLLMSLLTTAAATGIVVAVFQGLGGEAGIEQTNYLVLVAIALGLSTDYGVFLLTRIKEARDRGLPDAEAIAVGLQRTGAVVSAAAVLMAVALAAFVTGQMVFLREVGVGAAAAVLIDAFVVRALLVPALMRLLGGANWWSPRPLRRLHARLGPAIRSHASGASA